MRTLAVAALTGFVALMVASTASAAPSLSVLWTGTTGSGTTGSTSISAQAGDTLTLDVLLNVPDTQVVGWDFGLYGTGVTGVSGIECPGGTSGGSSNNLLGNGTCVTASFTTITPLQPGVTVSGSNITNFDGGTVTPFGPLAQPLFVGRAVFTVTGAGGVQLSFSPGGDSTIAITGGGTLLSQATATIVPEPGTMGLMGLGMAALGLAGRRRK